MNYFIYILVAIVIVSTFVFGQKQGISMLNAIDEKDQEDDYVKKD